MNPGDEMICIEAISKQNLGKKYKLYINRRDVYIIVPETEDGKLKYWKSTVTINRWQLSECIRVTHTAEEVLELMGKTKE